MAMTSIRGEPPVSAEPMPFAAAAHQARTGDVWLFRGTSPADRAIRLVTNSPVNHVSVVLAIDDLPPLLWHAELGRSLVDAWTGTRHRGAQLHRLDQAVSRWVHRYGQRAWFRPIDITATRPMETAALEVVEEYSARGFPRSTRMARHWLAGRARRTVPLDDLYCAELAAVTYERMGLLTDRRPPNWYDPGTFWSGDRLELIGASLGAETAVTDIPNLEPDDDAPSRTAGDPEIASVR